MLTTVLAYTQATKKARFLARERAYIMDERRRIPDNLGVPPNHHGE
jgi:hypothetical protein